MDRVGRRAHALGDLLGLTMSEQVRPHPHGNDQALLVEILGQCPLQEGLALAHQDAVALQTLLLLHLNLLPKRLHPARAGAFPVIVNGRALLAVGAKVTISGGIRHGPSPMYRLSPALP